MSLKFEESKLSFYFENNEQRECQYLCNKLHWKENKRIEDTEREN